jgi:glycogen debranching enzyme
MKEARYVFNNCERLKKQEKKENSALFRAFLKNRHIKGLKIKNQELAANTFCALHTLDSFLVRGKSAGIYAGFPWFYQFWNRDEAVCLKALAAFDEKTALKIFSRRLGEFETVEFKTLAADEAGWFFDRAGYLIRKGLLRGEEKKRLIEALEKTIERELAERTRDGLAFNSPKETWMDSLDRLGARIEIQAMRLMMFCLAKDLSTSPRKKEYYAALESALRRAARGRFWDGALLADGFDPRSGETDWTVRPNIFLAAYVYPKLLDKEEWVKCFKCVLPKLWLEWGGLSTIDINSPEFHATHTGENPASYHNGDSWFYLNDIAAIVMGRIDARRFDYNIKKIFEAGSYDLLWSGICGFAAELSPASRFDSAGSPAQAWSSAAFLELLLEVDPRIIRDRNG